MSDKDKVLSRARGLGKNKPVIVRWEGAGDSSHVVEVLSHLSDKTYAWSGDTPIKYQAYVNLYEDEGSDVAQLAVLRLAGFHQPEKDRTVTLTYNVDLKRKSKAISQPEAHIMFVRNIMTTDESKSTSETSDGSGLLKVHKKALRNRSNSLTSGGDIRLGMSGSPGLMAASGTARRTSQVQHLFSNYTDLKSAATSVGLKPQDLDTRLGEGDFEQGVRVMLNNGTEKIGDVFYLTYQK